MFGVIIPATVGVLAVVNYFRRPKDYGVMTAERLSVYNAALSGALKDPNKLEALAGQFAAQGLKEQAKLLRQRAALRRLPEDVKKERQAVFRKAMASKNKAGILEVADAYDREGCTGAAMRLREKASGLPEHPESTEPEPPPPAEEPHAEVADSTSPEAEVSAPTEVQT